MNSDAPVVPEACPNVKHGHSRAGPASSNRSNGSGWLERVKTLVARWLPFATRSPHRHVQVFLRRQGYRIVEVLFWGRSYRVEKDGTDYLFKRTIANGLIFYRDVLPNIHGDFRRLALPEFVDGGRHKRLGHWVIGRWLEGRDFKDRWDEHHPKICGGKAIEPAYVDVVLELMEDLRRIDAAPFVPSGLQRRTRSFLSGRIQNQLDRARAGDLVSEHQQRRLLELLGPFLDRVDSGPLHLSNHDFNFHNFIELPAGKMAVIDWDVARISTFELEHCATYLWMLMWGHRAWADAFIRRAVARFDLDPGRVRGALLINTLNQAVQVWLERPELRRIALAALADALDDARFRSLVEPG